MRIQTIAAWLTAGGLALPGSLAAQDIDFAGPVPTSGGGGAAEGGAYKMRGTVGTYGTTPQSGGPYTLVGGYWPVVLVQTADAPWLEIGQVDGELRVWWEATTETFVLEECADLGDSADPDAWTEVDLPHHTNGTLRYVVVPLTPTVRAFRLIAPSEAP